MSRIIRRIERCPLSFASVLMISEEERRLIREIAPQRARPSGAREFIAILGVLPILGYVIANHGWLFIIAFFFIASGFAFSLRFLADGMPTWVLVIISVFTVASVGYSYLWLA